MAAGLGTVTILDGNGNPIQVQFLDQSGTGLGAWTSAHIIVDGVGGVNRALVTAANAIKVDGSGVTQPVSGTITASQGGPPWSVSQSGAPWGVTITPVATALQGIVPVFSSALETGHVIKASAGNLYGFEVTTTSVGGMILLHNSTTVPGAGAVTPVKAWQIGAGQTLTVGFDPPVQLGTGITLTFTTAATPLTQTNSSTAFFSGTAA